MLYIPSIAGYIVVKAAFTLSWMLPMTFMQMALPPMPVQTK
jgi:hypothetical protein